MKNKLLAFMLALLATAGTLFAQNRVMGTVTTVPSQTWMETT